MHPAFRDRIQTAARILREEGATGVYVFGSVADEREMLPGREPRDLDLAVEGLPPEAYVRVVGRLLTALDVPVDLVDLDRPTVLVRRLRERGSLRRVA
jgi:predicted nucleotidyltransferase